MSRLGPVLLAALSSMACPALAAEARLVAAFDDPAGDATGPGTYVPPTDPSFTLGDFDLRRFEVWDEGDTIRLEVTLGAPIARAAPRAAPGAAGGLTVQNVDVYVDSDPAPGSGWAACIPGRRVAFADGRTWETAVVLTPQPEVARAAIAAALPRAAGHVVIPTSLEIRGRTVVARIPTAAFGGPPGKGWGWSVQISGARVERGARSGRAAGPREPDAGTMPVLGAPAPWAFGGGPAGDAHPRVVDVLLPPGVDQRAVLGSFDATTGAFARVPFVTAASAGAPQASAPSPDAPSLGPRLAPSLSVIPPATVRPPPPAGAASGAAAAAPAGGGPVLTVAEVSDDLVTLAGANIGLVPGQTGRVMGRDGAIVAHVTIERVLENGAVARVVSGLENVRWGARVRFDAQAARR